jgi:hypothetical protein
MPGLHPVLMLQLTNAKEHLIRIWTTLRAWTVPQDGFRKYLYDIWQPLTILVLTASFAGTFFTVKDPYASSRDLFYCNADGNVQTLETGVTGGYKPLWDPNLFFIINVSVRDNFSFTQAKLIDAVWDLGIGRGGQLLAAVATYRVLRRSLTLVMESCTVTIPTITSVCCQQMSIWSSWHLLLDVFSTRASQQFGGKRLSLTGRRRLSMQLIACVYVLVFPTLTSVMTGYRTGFTGLFDYTNGTVSQVKPLSELGYTRMFLGDGSRIGLPDSIGYPPHMVPFSEEDDVTEKPVGIAAFLLDSSKSTQESVGALVDCKCNPNLTGPKRSSSNVLLVDYFTCLGIVSATQTMRNFGDLSSEADGGSLTLACAAHDCSCSIELWRADDYAIVSNNYASESYSTVGALLANMTSNITIAGAKYALPAPPLDLRFAFNFALPQSNFLSRLSGERNLTDGMDASEFWSNESFNRSDLATYNFGGAASIMGMYKDTTYTEDFVKRTGICIASEKYSWGFSSLLLLTFCVYTIIFATTLIALQTEVHRHSQFDRDHQSYSIYADILMIAEALKTIPEYDLLQLLQSPKVLEEKLGGRKHGMRFNVSGLRPARYREKEAEREKLWARLANEGRLRDERLALNARGDMELQTIEPVHQGSGLEGDGLMSRLSHEQASRDSVEDRTMSGAI